MARKRQLYWRAAAFLHLPQPNPFAGQASIGGRRWLVRIEIVVLEKQEYRDPGEHARPEYRLTAAGFDLCVVLGALQLWGDTYLQLPGGPVTAPASATPVNPSAWHSSTTPGHQSTRIRSGSTGPLPATPARLAFVSAQRKWIAPTAKRESLAK